MVIQFCLIVQFVEEQEIVEFVMDEVLFDFGIGEYSTCV